MYAYFWGDVNGDESINIFDVDLVVLFILFGDGTVFLGALFFELLDVDCSGAINIFDADLIVDMLFDFDV